MVLDDVEKAKKIINQSKNYNKRTIEEYFSKIYSFSTENLSGYLRQFSFKNKEVLTTGSSADQILNLINYGATTIDHFDINPFVKYYFALKKTAILELNPKKYIDFFYLKSTENNYHVFNEKIYQRLEKYLDYESRIFWNSLYNSFEPSVINEKLFFKETIKRYNLVINNEYLNKKNYSLIRKRIEHCEIKFINTNIINLPYNKKQYDFILLSNIFDYLYNLIVLSEYEFTDVLFAYRSFLMRLTNLLKDDGTMFFHYFWQIEENMVYDTIKKFLGNDSHISTVFFESANRKNSFEKYKFNNFQDGVMVYTKTR